MTILKTEEDVLRYMEALNVTPAEHTLALASANPDLMGVCRNTLQKEGCRIVTCENGPTTLSAMQQHKPTLLIIDEILHKWSGEETVYRLYATEGFFAARFSCSNAAPEPCRIGQ